MSDVLILLHGFGGGPKSFEELVSSLNLSEMGFLIPDFYDREQFHPEQGLGQWCEDFRDFVSINTNPDQRLWLLGYSMGGRLAMHALWDQPGRFAGAVFLSASPGLLTEGEKTSREKWDQQWAEKIATLENNELDQQWNSLEVFRGSPPVSLRSDVPTDILAKNLCQWSPSKHLFSVEDLKAIRFPLLWVCGGQDRKYAALYSQLREKGLPGDWKVVPGAGHRLLVTPGDDITEFVEEFLQTRGGHGE